MTMKVLTYAILFLLFCQSSLGSRITFQATPSNIYPVLTKTLQLRCAIQQNGRIIKRQIDPSLLPQPKSYTELKTLLARNTVATAATTTKTTAASVHVPTTNFPKSAQVEASHIMSIIVSRKDKATGLLEKVASLSSCDPPIAYTDIDKITVNGHSDSSPIPGELGYLEITWTHPIDYQSGNYTCEIFALDETLHLVSTSEAVQITASEPTIPELASIITELSQTVSELKNQTSHLQSQIQENALAPNNITKAQNIQTGPVYCFYNVKFDRPYNSKPSVLIALSGLAVSSYTGSVNITVENLNATGFTPNCAYSYFIPTAYWIAVGN